MPSIIYDVAVSIDGFISGPNDDISKFDHEGPVVDDYRNRLTEYGAAIMGRSTYEFGYKFGLKPGQNPYPHLKTYVFSRSLEVPPGSNITVVGDPVEHTLPKIQSELDEDIYLCGGGDFAGSLLDLGLIDIIRLKRAPLLLAGGTRLFGHAKLDQRLCCLSSKLYDNGYIYQEFAIRRS